jgi:two-component system sensor histidine kinase GlrK
MRAARPRSLTGLLLIGFTLVTVPLIVAAIGATMQMRRLTQQSETLVLHGMDATRHSQELFRETTAMERTARLYQVLGDVKLKAVLAEHHAGFERSLNALSSFVPDKETDSLIGRIREAGTRLVEVTTAGAPASPRLAQALDEFGRTGDLVGSIAARIAAGINSELQALRVSAAATQRNLLWQTLCLIPIMAAIVGLFVSLLARPIRQIDQAISELGRGTFSRPVSVQGPTDLERLGRQLEWLRMRLLDLAQEKNRFLRHISHELKTPLANIREGTELMIEGAVGALDAAQLEVVTILRENGIKLQRLIENLLSFSAWQAKSVGLELGRFPLRTLIKQVAEAQALTLVAQRIKLDVKVQDVEITADRGKLRLILDNLLSNAVKFTPPGGTIYIHALTYRDHLTIDVADTGPGIPKEDRAQVFEAFYTGKSQAGGHVKGTGIGLSVVMEFVQAHGGTIELVDGVHAGAHFRIRLPARAPAAQPEATDAAA